MDVGRILWVVGDFSFRFYPFCSPLFCVRSMSPRPYLPLPVRRFIRTAEDNELEYLPEDLFSGTPELRAV